MVLSLSSVAFASDVAEEAIEAARLIEVIRAANSEAPAADVAEEGSLAGISKVRWEGDLVYITVNLYAASAGIAVGHANGTTAFLATSSTTYPVWVGSSINEIFIFIEQSEGGSLHAGTWRRP